MESKSTSKKKKTIFQEAWLKCRLKYQLARLHLQGEQHENALFLCHSYWTIACSLLQQKDMMEVCSKEYKEIQDVTQKEWQVQVLHNIGLLQSTHFKKFHEKVVRFKTVLQLLRDKKESEWENLPQPLQNLFVSYQKQSLYLPILEVSFVPYFIEGNKITT